MTDEKINVSVTYTIYDDFDFRKLEVSLFYLGFQEEVSFEAVIINATEKRISLPSFCKEVILSQTEAGKNLGKIRNIALKNCSGNYIYTCDADIIFIDKLFLKKLILLQRETKTALKKVDLLRLPYEEFDNFYEIIKNDNIPELNISNYSVSLSNNFPFKMAVVNGFKFIQREDSKDSLSCVHAGSIFGKKEMFDKVGGYSEEYLVYGWEDSDLQWKLEQKNGMNKIKNLKVVHLDHKKPYYNKNIFEKNKKLFFKRVKAGVDKAIKRDIKNYNKIVLENIKQVYK